MLDGLSLKHFLHDKKIENLDWFSQTEKIVQYYVIIGWLKEKDIIVTYSYLPRVMSYYFSVYNGIGDTWVNSQASYPTPEEAIKYGILQAKNIYNRIQKEIRYKISDTFLSMYSLGEGESVEILKINKGYLVLLLDANKEVEVKSLFCVDGKVYINNKIVRNHDIKF